MIGQRSPQSQINIKLNSSPTHVSDRDFMTVKRIENFSYGINDEIGLGLTSRVYKGKNDLTNDPVAVKVIDLKSSQDPLQKELMVHEINTLTKIKSAKCENLLKLQDVIRTKNNLYIITEFCEGKDVGKLLRQKKVLSESEAQSIVRQIINGYRELYLHGIIHRDLKLSNLFIKNGKVKIADFGFAIPEEKCSHSFGYNVGSPYYMPPETLKYNKYSYFSDVWAMGVMTFQLVFGRLPWKDKIQAKLYDMIINHPIDKIFDPEIPISQHLQHFIKRCLAINLKDRLKPEDLFNYQWPLAANSVQGVVQPKKIPEVIKVPGHNYAVYNGSSKVISYESKKQDLDDFRTVDPSSCDGVIVSQLDYCKFLTEIYKHLLKINRQEFKGFCTEIALLVKDKLKMLGEIVRTEKNLLSLGGFSGYIKSGNWQNLKQVIIRYDIQFRQLLKGEPNLKKNEVAPFNQPLLIKKILQLKKYSLEKNYYAIDMLSSYRHVRKVGEIGNYHTFGQHSGIEKLANMATHLKPELTPIDFQDLHFRLQKMGL